MEFGIWDLVIVIYDRRELYDDIKFRLDDIRLSCRP